MGMKGERRIRHISKNAIVLNDRIKRDGRHIAKQRLVLLYPEKLSWTNTHLAGPNKRSQFVYEIAPEGKGTSRLDFTGFQINYDDGDITPAAVAALADRLRKR